jgi:antitoxin VapB
MGKQLNIKSDRAYQLASELAAERGVGLTQAVLQALELAKADRPPRRSPEEVQATIAEWTRLIDRNVDALRASGLRYDSDKELYDEDGIPI